MSTTGWVITVLGGALAAAWELRRQRAPKPAPVLARVDARRRSRRQ